MAQQRDMKRELALLKRLGEVRINGVLAREYTLPDGTLWMQRYHQRLFDTDIAQYVHGEESKRSKTRIGTVFVYSFLFFVSVLGVLWGLFSRPKILLFSVDKVSDPKTKGDFRITHVYEALQELNLSYQESFHTALSRDVYRKYFSRFRLTWYLEGIDAPYFFWRFISTPFRRRMKVVFENLPEGDEIFAESVLRKYLRIKDLHVYRTRVLTSLYELVGYKAVVCIDDVRHYHEIVTGGIPSIAVQHGHFTKYHVGWLALGAEGKVARADKLLVWNTYWKDELTRLGSIYGDDVVVAGGNKSKDFSFGEGEDKVVLIPFETVAPNEEVGEYVALLTECGYRVVVKGRTDVPADEQESVYGVPVEIITDLSRIPKPFACVGVYSTFLYDMHALNIPIGILETSMDYGEGMVLGGVASMVGKKRVCEEVKSLMWKNDARLEDTTDFTETLHGVLKEAGVV